MTPAQRQTIERLFREHGKGVGGFLFARTGDSELAEEITGRVFLQVVRCIDQLRGSLLPWLWRIVRNELARHFRGPRIVRPLQDVLPDQRLEPADAAERCEQIRLLKSALDQLDDGDQELIGMKFFLRMPNTEIAQALGLTASHVGVRLFRAVQRLRTLMPSETIPSTEND